MLTKPNTPKTKYAFLAVVSAVFFLLLISKPLQVKGQVLAADSLALVDLYNATNGASWGNNINWVSGAVPTWNGITVVGNRVTQVDLNTNNLVGTIPTSIGDLTALTNLNLGGNFINGSLPTEIGNLTALVDLQLWNNQLSGQLPTSIGNLTNLTYLDLAPNQFSGAIPTEIGNLVNLTTLRINNNQFSGGVPASLVNLTSLTALYLQGNSLTNLPDLSGIVSLATLDVSNNKFQFLELEPHKSIATFTYAPQKAFGTLNPKEFVLRTGEPLTLTFPAVAGTGVTYQWQNNAANVGGQIATTLNVPSFSALDEGTYTLLANHPVLTLLTLVSQPREVLLANESFFQIDNTNSIFGETLAGVAYAQAWADFDQDGDEDLFVGTTDIGGSGKPNKLYQNNGNGTFTSLAAGALTTDLADVRFAAWGDINNDGFPDLFVPDLGYRNGAPFPANSVIYVNNQDNTFTSLPLPAVANLDNIENGAFGDYDKDGYIDLAVFN
ncbi:MAG: FG-GAP-like repeat-containing protein, partial [Imperialibacter sp.]